MAQNQVGEDLLAGALHGNEQAPRISGVFLALGLALFLVGFGLLLGGRSKQSHFGVVAIFRANLKAYPKESDGIYQMIDFLDAVDGVILSVGHDPGLAIFAQDDFVLRIGDADLCEVGSAKGIDQVFTDELIGGAEALRDVPQAQVCEEGRDQEKANENGERYFFHLAAVFNLRISPTMSPRMTTMVGVRSMFHHS